MLKKQMNDKINSYFQRYSLGETFPQGLEMRRGVFCDLNKSLIIKSSLRADATVNMGVRAYLRQQKEQGREIHLISKIPDNSIVLGTGLKREFGGITAKFYLRDALLETLIDDNPDYLTSENWIDPSSPKGRDFFNRFLHTHFASDEYVPPPEHP